jgi:hypothetical protein
MMAGSFNSARAVNARAAPLLHAEVKLSQGLHAAHGAPARYATRRSGARRRRARRSSSPSPGGRKFAKASRGREVEREARPHARERRTAHADRRRHQDRRRARRRRVDRLRPVEHGHGRGQATRRAIPCSMPRRSSRIRCCASCGRTPARRGKRPRRRRTCGMSALLFSFGFALQKEIDVFLSASWSARWAALPPDSGSARRCIAIPPPAPRR